MDSNRHGNKLALVEGYLFRKDSQREDGTWYCKCLSYPSKNCNARAIVKGYPNNPIATQNGIHNHSTPDVAIWRYDAISIAKKLVHEQPTSATSEILTQVQQTMDDPYDFFSTQYKSLEQVIRRTRAKNRVRTRPSLQERRLMELQNQQQRQRQHLQIPERTQERQTLSSQQQDNELQQQRLEIPNLTARYPEQFQQGTSSSSQQQLP